MLHQFIDGDMFEGGGFQIETEKKTNTEDGAKPCKHCHSIETEERSRVFGDSPYYIQTFICPAVVITYNEFGNNSTGVCLGCIMDAAKTI